MTSPSIQEDGKTTKRGRGRPKGHIVTKALEAARDAAVSIEVMDTVVSGMRDHQRLLFESIMSGDDELVAALKSGHAEWFTGICKIVFDKEGEKLPTSAVTLGTLGDLSQESYQKLVRICQSQVRKVTGEVDYREYTDPIREYIKKFAPIALGTIVGIAQNGIKEENKLKAARDLLDRAGEREPEPEKDVIVPVQVNIMLTQEDGRVIQYEK